MAAQAQDAAELIPWKEAKKDESRLEEVLAYKKKLEAQCQDWGLKQGISDLTLAGVLTVHDPKSKVFHFWNPKGGKEKTGQWVRYREGDEVPRWLQELGKKAKSYKYPDGDSIPQEAWAQWTGRSNAPKLNSVGDLLR